MDDAKAIEKIVETYWKSYGGNDKELLASIFYDEATVSGCFGDDFLAAGPVAEFIEAVCSEEAAFDSDCDFRCVVDGIWIDGPIATVRFLEYDDKGTDFVTHFQLVKRNDEWKVISKLFTTA